MIWTATQRRNRNFFYFYVTSPSKSFYMHFQLRRNAAQTLASYYKPALTWGNEHEKNMLIIFQCQVWRWHHWSMGFSWWREATILLKNPQYTGHFSTQHFLAYKQLSCYLSLIDRVRYAEICGTKYSTGNIVACYNCSVLYCRWYACFRPDNGYYCTPYICLPVCT